MDAGVRSTVKFKTVFIALTFGIVACAALSLAAQKKGAQISGPRVFAADKGKLTIKLAGQTVGHEEFEIAPSGGGWLAKGTAEIKPPESSGSKVSGSLTLQPDGAPISYEWTAERKKQTALTSSSPMAWRKSLWRCKARAPFSKTSPSIRSSSPFWTTTSTINTLSWHASTTGQRVACKLFPCSFPRN